MAHTDPYKRDVEARFKKLEAALKKHIQNADVVQRRTKKALSLHGFNIQRWKHL